MKQGSHKYLKLIRAYCKAHGTPIHGPTRIVIIREVYSPPHFTGKKGHSIDTRTGGNATEFTPREFVGWFKSTYRVEMGAQWVMVNIPEAWLDICTLILKGKVKDILS